MNQLVFVHGVDGPRSNTADSKDYLIYKKSSDARNRRFKQFAFDGRVSIVAPLWSIHGAQPAWDLACIPRRVIKTGVAALGIAQLVEPARMSPMLASHGDFLSKAAKLDLDSVIGSLSCIQIRDADDDPDPARTIDVEDFWAAATRALEDPSARQSLTSATDDRDFVDRLKLAAQINLHRESLSLGQSINDVVVKLFGSAVDVVNSPVVLAVRNTLTPQLAIFIGDVFTYLKEGVARQNIRRSIREALLTATEAAKTNKGRIVLVGHSMGGVILYDLLSDIAFVESMSKDLGEEFKADLLLTVGSQVALFEELKLFTASNPSDGVQSGSRLKKPDCIHRWWNAFNRLDVLSFIAEPVFFQVSDFEVNTTAGVLDAHSAYFTNSVFYRHLNIRLKEAGILR